MLLPDFFEKLRLSLTFDQLFIFRQSTNSQQSFFSIEITLSMRDFEYLLCPHAFQNQ